MGILHWSKLDLLFVLLFTNIQFCFKWSNNVCAVVQATEQFPPMHSQEKPRQFFPLCSCCCILPEMIEYVVCCTVELQWVLKYFFIYLLEISNNYQLRLTFWCLIHGVSPVCIILWSMLWYLFEFLKRFMEINIQMIWQIIFFSTEQWFTESWDFVSKFSCWHGLHINISEFLTLEGIHQKAQWYLWTKAAG